MKFRATILALAFLFLLAMLAMPACSRGEPDHSVILLEVGQEPPAGAIDMATNVIVEALGDNETVEVTVIDSGNADVLDNLALPGVNQDGSLRSDATTSVIRKEDAEDLRPEIEAALTSAFVNAPDFSEGRDILGALTRAAETSPEEIVLISSSGGISRVPGDAGHDFLVSIPVDDPVKLELDSSTRVTFIGIGDVTAEGVPDQSFTSSLVSYFDAVCAATNATDCQVVR